MRARTGETKVHVGPGKHYGLWFEDADGVLKYSVARYNHKSSDDPGPWVEAHYEIRARFAEMFPGRWAEYLPMPGLYDFLDGTRLWRGRVSDDRTLLFLGIGYEYAMFIKYRDSPITVRDYEQSLDTHRCAVIEGDLTGITVPDNNLYPYSKMLEIYGQAGDWQD